MNEINKRQAFSTRFITQALLLLCISCLFSNCYQAKEGCLDIAATNFDVEADESCCLEETCCCIFPTLSLSISHKLTTDDVENFPLSSPITLDSTHFFIVENMRFYLTDVKLVNATTAIGVTDTIDLPLYDIENDIINTVTLEDNFTLVKRDNFNYSIGEFRAPNTYTSLQFNIGIAGDANHAVADSIISTHPLSVNGTDSLQIDPVQGYIFNQIELYKDTISATPLSTYSITELVPIELAFTSPLVIENGFNVTLNLRINYLDWFKGINFAVDSDDEIKSKLTENTYHVFELGI